ncbi:MAG: hypothetical protein EU541_04760 [Promethearchaeota archaeon]|nr:MAG: hypothetical protein EU541_04760 [Candidatus Lokiarchaeota archaeon]
MNEFKINEYIKLKLEQNKVNIYIDGKKIIQCKYLLLQKPQDNQTVQEENISSIDQITEKLDKSLEMNDSLDPQDHPIDPETEFWAHCSNIQAWAENNYNTQMLHVNLSFPLLKRLTVAGDPLAKEVFKSEIIKRFRSGDLNVMTFLTKEGYLEFLDWDEGVFIYKDLDFETRKELQQRVKEAAKAPRDTFIIEHED